MENVIIVTYKSQIEMNYFDEAFMIFTMLAFMVFTIENGMNASVHRMFIMPRGGHK